MSHNYKNKYNFNACICLSLLASKIKAHMLESNYYLVVSSLTKREKRIPNDHLKVSKLNTCRSQNQNFQEIGVQDNSEEKHKELIR